MNDINVVRFARGYEQLSGAERDDWLEQFLHCCHYLACLVITVRDLLDLQDPVGVDLLNRTLRLARR